MASVTPNGSRVPVVSVCVRNGVDITVSSLGREAPRKPDLLKQAGKARAPIREFTARRSGLFHRGRHDAEQFRPKASPPFWVELAGRTVPVGGSERRRHLELRYTSRPTGWRGAGFEPRVELRSVAYPADVRRVLLTGMSGTGKSTLIRELGARGYRAIDTDSDEWSEWSVAGASDQSASGAEPDWVWREDRIQRLLSSDDVDVVFVGGCKSNQVKFYEQFNHIVLLTAPVRLLVERLSTRTSNPYGKQPDELARVLRHLQTIEPRLRAAASVEIDTSGPIDQVVQTILDLVST